MQPDLQHVLQCLNETPRRVPSIFCYDELGSKYFSERCSSPEYYLTRIELGLLERAASELPRILGSTELIELGCGNGEKLAPLLTEYGTASKDCSYLGIDISRQALDDLDNRIHISFPNLSKPLIEGTFEQGLKQAASKNGTPLILFLGSTLGNMTDREIEDFLSMIKENMATGCHVLIGVDFVKDKAKLEAAYNDTHGAGRRMELNALKNMNSFMVEISTLRALITRHIMMKKLK